MSSSTNKPDIDALALLLASSDQWKTLAAMLCRENMRENLEVRGIHRQLFNAVMFANQRIRDALWTTGFCTQVAILVASEHFCGYTREQLLSKGEDEVAIVGRPACCASECRS